MTNDTTKPSTQELREAEKYSLEYADEPVTYHDLEHAFEAGEETADSRIAALEAENAELKARLETTQHYLDKFTGLTSDGVIKNLRLECELAKLKEGREVLAEGWVYREGKSWVVSAVEFLPDMDEALSAIPVQLIRRGDK